MNYISTRDNHSPISAAEAIKLGMVPEGGLFVPSHIPTLKEEDIFAKKNNSYQDLAVWILNLFLKDFKSKTIKKIVNQAYCKNNFPSKQVTPLVRLNKYTYLLILWKGPTAAFKDLALQLLPYLLKQAVLKTALNKEIVILVATSGDTGKAALEGFKDVEGIRIIVFFPDQGVSKIQKDQMLTTGGQNTSVVAIQGNFDDCQSAVKELFADQDFNKLLKINGYQFSSANSINWGRLLPQIVYYFAAYLKLLRNNNIKKGENFNIAVPTGNFGNILAAFYSYKMGLPVNKLICASNENNVLTDFIKTGRYDIKRDFKKTISPSMDILISSNLERFLFEITGHDSTKIKRWYHQLADKKSFTVDQKTLTKIQNLFVGYYAKEKEVKKTIKNTYHYYDYLIDPHTGVGLSSLNKYRNNSGDLNTTVLASTANPYKFSKAVLHSIKKDVNEKNQYELIDRLNKLTKMKVHRGLADLETKKIQHKKKINLKDIKEEIKDILSL